MAESKQQAITQVEHDGSFGVKKVSNFIDNGAGGLVRQAGTSTGAVKSIVAKRKDTGGSDAIDGAVDTLYTAEYDGEGAQRVHVIGDGDKFVVSNANEGSAIGTADAIPIAGEDESGKKVNASIQTRRQTPSGPALNVQIGPGDIISNIPIVMDFEHHQVHEGESFLAQDTQASLGAGTVKYSITVPVFATTIQGPHLLMICDVYNGSARIDLYEGSTFTSGSAITVYNRNRNINVAAGTTFKTGVTSTDGTQIKSFFAGAGAKQSGSGRSESEMILKSNTIYRVDLVGLVVNTQAILSFLFYEDLGV